MPGIVPLRPLAVTELLDGAVRVVWSQRRGVWLLAAPFAVALAVGQALLSYARFGGANVVLVAVGGLLLVPLVGAPLTTLLAPTASAAVAGRPIDAVTAATGMARRLPAAIVLAVVITLGLGVGLALLVVPGVFLWGWWSVAAPAFALERLGPVAALRRARQLVRGEFGRTWGARALGWLVVQVVSSLVVVPVDLLATFASGGHVIDGTTVDQPLTYVAISAAGGVVAGLVTLPVSAVIDVLIYSDLRMRREGMDLVMTLPPVAAR